MTTSMVSAMILRDMICGKGNPYARTWVISWSGILMNKAGTVPVTAHTLAPKDG